ncbi:MAG: hypothetical protein K8F25_14935 [Fimbriimonadaceae bacterium]|nr:hypothetical protein [Alphaproteobacteria bacterium]
MSTEDARKAVIAKKAEISANISTTCRFIGFGLLAVFYTIQTGDSEFAAKMRTGLGCYLWAIGALGAVTVLLDYMQYLCAWWSAQKAMKDDDFAYSKNSYVYRAWHWFFYAKQWVAFFGAVTLCLMVFFSS